MIRGVVLDLDGTVYRGGRPLPGAVEAVAMLRQLGLAVVFVSNNPTVPAEAYAERLSGMGIPTTPQEVVTSGGLTTEWLRTEHRGGRVLLVSETSLHYELVAGGVAVTDEPSEADIVVVSFDRTFDYAKWTAAFHALRGGALFVATNPDATCPVDGGEVPDCAGIIAALEASSGRLLDVVIGKPSEIIAAAAAERLQSQLDSGALDPEEVLVVGDRVETDIRLGANAGFGTALVLTGVSTRDDLVDADVAPTHVLAGLGDVTALVSQPDQERTMR